MIETAPAPALSPARRKRENDRLARRATTAALSLAICLTGFFSGLAAAARPASAGGATLTPQPGDSEAALTKALNDYRAAAAAHAASTAPDSTRGKPLAPPRVAPKAAAKPPTAVSGGS